ncbi:MAG TPA: hydantoinase B/oxoprolinase family protein [Alphaproteobacteria bacterium]|jgi:N-methylhydantoinase B|nr:hydantoinase B/oxoprolinase family protein [Alphaproteobacteria bacterium]MDP6271188.1 hydantoinase B/oxoprolinase family protein [Alphaproteobacteria bacterium]HJM50579.1 hydantoinase B/oxoprolinase family protein [Alphaproteobacteria bacterium]
MKTIDAVDLGIMWDRLTAITDEILLSIVRTAFSVGVREAWDLACVVFDAEGRALAQATLSMPAFIGTAPLSMQQMLAKFPSHTWQPGDVVVTNDPWLGTGHTPDICVTRPAFVDGRLVGFVMTITHLPDIGGVGLSAHNREVYEEGLVLPICKLYEAGVPDEKLHDLIAINVRVPEQVFGDILANVSGCTVGERLIGELMTEYGLGDLEALAEGVISQSEQAIRREIAAIPDGRYKNEVEIETVGDTAKLACTVIVEDDHVTVDFTGTSDAVPFAINVPVCYTTSFTTYIIKCLTTPSIPNNQGATNPVTVTAPKGCILNAIRPSPTGGRHSVGWFIVPLVMGALAEALPDRVQADAGMASLFIVLSSPTGGEANSNQYFLAGGLGGMAGLDGQHTTPFPTNNAVVASEVWENVTGMTVVRRQLLPDSGGPGEYRGGLGQIAEMVNTSPNPISIFMFGMRTEFPAEGHLGGKAGAKRRFEIDGEAILPKGRVELGPGQTFTIHEAGGGGFGDPFKRDPERVLSDVTVGAVSSKAALIDYGVRVDLEAGTADRGD